MYKVLAWDLENSNIHFLKAINSATFEHLLCVRYGSRYAKNES